MRMDDLSMQNSDTVRKLLEDLRAARFAGIQGARVALSIPIAERLLNDALALALPPTLPVRNLSVKPLANNQLSVSGSVTNAPFLPPLALTFEIDVQPTAPDWRLRLRMLSLPGLLSMAGSLFKLDTMLPPGVRLEGQRVVVDIRALLEQRGFGDLLPHVDAIRVRSEAGRVVVELEAVVK
jgi:hypothetical protein